MADQAIGKISDITAAQAGPAGPPPASIAAPDTSSKAPWDIASKDQVIGNVSDLVQQHQQKLDKQIAQGFKNHPYIDFAGLVDIPVPKSAAEAVGMWSVAAGHSALSVIRGIEQMFGGAQTQARNKAEDLVYNHFTNFAARNHKAALIAGGVTGAFADPVTAPLMAITAPESISGAIAQSAAIGSGMGYLSYVDKGQTRLGNAAAGGIFGAVMGGGVSGLANVFRGLRGKTLIPWLPQKATKAATRMFAEQNPKLTPVESELIMQQGRRDIQNSIPKPAAGEPDIREFLKSYHQSAEEPQSVLDKMHSLKNALDKPGFLRTPEEKVLVDRANLSPEEQQVLTALSKPGFLQDASDRLALKAAKEIPHATQKGQIAQDNLPEYTGVPQGENVPADQAQIRQEAGGQTSGGGGVPGGGQQTQAQGRPFTGVGAAQGGAIDLTPITDAATQMQKFLREQQTGFSHAADMENDLYRLRAATGADKLAVVKAARAVKEAGLTNADMENIAAHIEDPSVQLTDAQRAVKTQLIDPLRRAAGHEGNYFPRQVVNHSVLDRVIERLKGGKRAFGPGGNVLRKTHGGMKKRVMGVLVESDGTRSVISAKPSKGGKLAVTRWENQKGTPLGEYKPTTLGSLRDREEAPIKKRLAKLQTEFKTLSATKSRQAAAPRRLDNISKQIATETAKLDAVGARYTLKDPSTEVWLSPDGKVAQRVEGTMREIEQASPVRYHKNAFANIGNSFVETRASQRAAQYLDSLKQSPEFNAIASKELPPGSKWRTTALPQFHGYYFEPRVANMLDQYYRRYHPGGAAADPLNVGLLTTINNIGKRVLFLVPYWHDMNISTIGAVTRGVSGWTTRAGFRRLKDTWKPAVREVYGLGEDYMRLYAKGVPFQKVGAVTGDFYKTIVNSVADEIQRDPSVATRLTEALGVPGERIGAVLKKIGINNQEAMWSFNDFILYRQILENKAKGLEEDAAIRQALQTIPKYQLPMGSKLGNLLSHPNISWFAPYHYDMLRGWGNMMKNVVAGAKGDKLEALDKLAMLGIMSTVMFPLLDAGIQKATGNQNLYVHRFGLSDIPYSLYELSQGQKSLVGMLASQLTPAPGTTLFGELFFNRNFWNGRAIRDTKESPATQMGQALKFGTTMFSPVTNYQRGGVAGAIEGTVGIQKHYEPKVHRGRRRRRENR